MGVWIFNAAMILWLAGEIGVRVRQAKMAGRIRTSEHRTLVIFVVLGGGGALLGGRVGKALPALDWHNGTPLFLTAAAIVLAGLAFRFWAIFTLGKFFRSSVHVQEGHQVISDGPYRALRHPSYTGLMVIFIGAGLSFGNAAAMAVFLAGTAIALAVRIRVEERVLSDELGDAYREFARTRARLVPHVW
ncbi:methyltransferase family protein [Actinomadura rupiterrae]|uniref:methyltransferase family protein n=1 Tax=Actinomadura rupiterrae TaxID=559627 RepID=UPI0020A4F8E0|nr:isoprenylcysteine carboxylmethyltransferase family protein [Actinomadura rupiterrae]MCP2335082.1 protein-S-isoprenylcysteine O-methyltransferase Ste14 [Actinomadura rupiterrae]